MAAGRIAVDVGNSARDVVLSNDTDKAAQIRPDDDAIDDFGRQLFTVLMEQGVEPRCGLGR